jgi:hypothetical protein
MQGVASEDGGGEGVDERFERRRRGTNPARQGRGFQADPVAGENLGLAVKRQSLPRRKPGWSSYFEVVVLRDDDYERAAPFRRGRGRSRAGAATTVS